MTTKTKRTDLAALLKRVEGVMELPEGGERQERLRVAIRVGLAKRSKRNSDLSSLGLALHCVTLAKTGLGELGEPRDLCEPEQELAHLVVAAAELEEVLANVAAELDAAEAVCFRPLSRGADATPGLRTRATAWGPSARKRTTRYGQELWGDDP